MFKKAVIVDGGIAYEQDKETEYQDNIPGTSIKVILMPGHAHEHASLVIGTDKGMVVVAADVFWWTDNEKQTVDDPDTLIHKSDSFTQDKRALVKSRRKVLQIADWIIPGHGRMFRNPKKKE
ncbi:MAG: hypothetical protein ACD_51C00343G0001 [uncultured bacterium]|nr:MAG: hypothetical protein ACD_51C00343G0001 [uncultured bacterium]